jgi:RNA polymerase sigma-70 factor (ECF subfamily)
MPQRFTPRNAAWRGVTDAQLMHTVAAAAAADADRADRATADQAFTELVRRHRPRVQRLVNAYVRNTEQAEDLTQEVFCRLYQHAGSYVHQGCFVAWLRRIAMNLAKNFLRRQRQTTWVPLTELSESEERMALGYGDRHTNIGGDRRFDPVAALESSVLKEEVRTALWTLPDEQRQALVLRYFAGLSVAEIARVSACPEGTVKSRLSYGVRRLRQMSIQRLTVQDWEPEQRE